LPCIKAITCYSSLIYLFILLLCYEKQDSDIKPIFLAIASAPTGTPPKPTPPGKKKSLDEADAAAGPESTPVPATWEFLIKKTDNNDWITSIKTGQSVSISQVMGGGFPIQENFEGFKYDFPTQNILLFATGSGIAPIRSAIESKQLNIAAPGSGGRTCTLYYGVKTPDDMPYVSKFAQWEELGVQVVPVISQPDSPCESGAIWRGRTGYVQNALEEDGVPIPRNSGALLCGVKGMCESVKSTLMDSGMFEGRMLFNF
jgi:ferredoxin-NADP reductase